MGLSTVSSKLVSRRCRAVFDTRQKVGGKRNKQGENRRRRGHARQKSSERRKWKLPKWSDARRASSKGPGTPQTRAITSHFRKLPAIGASVDEQVITLKALYTYFRSRRYTYGAAGDKIQSNTLSRTRPSTPADPVAAIFIFRPFVFILPFSKPYVLQWRARNDSLCLTKRHRATDLTTKSFSRVGSSRKLKSLKKALLAI